MKKIAIMLFAIGAIVLVSGCAKKGADNNKTDAGQTAKEESGGIISSIKDAVGLGKKMQCTYTFKAGNDSFTTTAFIEGQKYRGESEVMGNKQLMVFDGETMYTWSESGKTGTKWTKGCMDDLNKDKPADVSDSNIPAPTKDEVKDAADAFKDATDTKCVPVDSIDFSVPSDVTFSDMCEQLKKMQDVTKNMPKGANMPKGVNVPKGANVPGGIMPE